MVRIGTASDPTQQIILIRWGISVLSMIPCQHGVANYVDNNMVCMHSKDAILPRPQAPPRNLDGNMVASGRNSEFPENRICRPCGLHWA